MPRVTGLQAGFDAGELGALLDARIDLPIYAKGCRALENFIPTPQGPAKRRLGSHYVREVKDSADNTRLIEFIFSDIDSHILEFGDTYLRFYQSQAPILEATKAITGITQANPAVVTAVGHSYVTGDTVEIEDVAGMTEINGTRDTITFLTANTFELDNTDSTGFTAYSSGGTSARVYEITTPYLESEVFDFKYDQLSDIAYFAHPSHRPQKLSRVGLTNWTMADMDNRNGPVLDVNETATTVTLTGSVAKDATSTWTASTGIFQSTHVGSVWAIADTSNANIGYARMTSFTSSTVADFTNQTALHALSTASTNWYEAAWSDVRGWPRAVAFHEQRLCFAGTNENPLTIWLSNGNGAFETFDIGTAQDNDAIVATLTGRTNTIQWLISDGDFLVGGTFGGIAFLGSGSNSLPITPTNIKAKNGTAFGSSRIQAVAINNLIQYIQRSKTKSYQINYDDVTLNYTGQNLNILNDDILDAGVEQLAIQQEKDVVVFHVRTDGQLVGLTQEATEGFNAWHRWVTGEQADGTEDDYTSVAVIPGTKFDEVWTIAERTVNGNTKKYVEFIEPDESKLWYVDSAVEVDGTQAETLTLATKAITGATQANPVVITAAAHSYSDGDNILIESVGGMTELNDITYQIANSTASTFELQTLEGATVDGTGFTAYTSGGTAMQNTVGEIQTFTAGGTTFVSGDVGRKIFVKPDTGEQATRGRATIDTFTSPTVVDAEITQSFESSSIAASGWDITNTVITGLDHLEGRVVQVESDGSFADSFTVVGGQVTISDDDAGALLHAGLGYNSDISPMLVEAGGGNGPAIAKVKRMHSATIRVRNTLGLKVGRDFETLDIVPFRDNDDLMNVAPPTLGAMRTDDAEVLLNTGWDTEGNISIRQDLPLPATIVAIIPKLVTNDK